jgi:group II intron reverse transcriptase/maturase
MIPTSCVLERIGRNAADHREGVYTRLYRYLLREDAYYTAYRNLYANRGASTGGIDDDTADGFGREYIRNIIDDLRDLTYEPKPVRRKHIPKQNSTVTRPIGIPTFRDKLVQEVIRMYLEAIYEPTFSDRSHGFRPHRSCHSALRQIRGGFGGIKWFIEGDIRGCFDSIDHEKLLNILSEKIKDSKFVDLIRKFLKAGYVEDWEYHRTHSGTPQGGIISPMLANIYLNELDREAERLKAAFDRPRSQGKTSEYTALERRIVNTGRKISRARDESRRAQLVEEIKCLKKELRRTPCTQTDDKKIVYVRYADDFLIGVNGSKEDCKNIKTLLKEILANEYGLELSGEKTKVTHSSKSARFLGYDVRVRRCACQKRTGSGVVKRTLNNTVELLVPLQEKIETFVIKRGIAKFGRDGKLKAYHRTALNNRTDLEVLNAYNAQTRGKCNYYRMASNYSKLGYFVYLMECSCLKTIARRHKTTIAKIRNRYGNGKSWGVPYHTKAGEKRAMIVQFTQLRKERIYTPTVDETEDGYIYHNRKNEIADRLFSRKCELCGKENTDLEVHHVRSLKQLGDKEWECVMKEKRRKTLMVCNSCHCGIHSRGDGSATDSK